MRVTFDYHLIWHSIRKQRIELLIHTGKINKTFPRLGNVSGPTSVITVAFTNICLTILFPFVRIYRHGSVFKFLEDSTFRQCHQR